MYVMTGLLAQIRTDHRQATESTLFNLSLASHDFRDAAIPYIWEDVDIDLAESHGKRGMVQIAKLRRLAAHADLGLRFVKSFQIDGGEIKHLTVKEQDEFYTTLEKCILFMKRLESCKYGANAFLQLTNG